MYLKIITENKLTSQEAKKKIKQHKLKVIELD